MTASRIRLFIGLFALLSAAPLVTEAFGLDHLFSSKKHASQDENRRAAALPASPTNLAEASALPGDVERYIDDHFGLRRPMIEANDRLRWTLFHEAASPKLLVGRNGRLFLDLPGEPFDSIQRLCGLGVSGEAPHGAAKDLARVIDRLKPLQPHLLYLLVPTAPAVYPEDLPGWLDRQCAATGRPADIVAADLAADREHSANFLYPLDLMRSLSGDRLVIPKTNFHWDGLGVRYVAEAAMKRGFGITPQVEVQGYAATRASDLTRFNPGAGIENHLLLPDFAAAGITECQGARCFPELGEIGPVLESMSRFTRSGTPERKLLILSDSFGAGIAGYFAEGFTEVRHFSTNNFDRLTPAQRERFKAAIWRDYAPDSLVLVYHDGSALENPAALLQRFFGEEADSRLRSIRTEG